MATDGIAIPTDVTAADEFERRAGDFAALAESAANAEDCIRYRDLEQGYRLRAEYERALQLTHLYISRSRVAA